MNLEELRALLKAKKEEIRGFITNKEADKAEKAMEEKRNLEKMINAAEELEADEKRDLESQKKKKTKTKAEESNEFRSIVKSVMGEELSNEERATIMTTDNSAVLPKQFVNQLQEIKKGFGSLKPICDIIPVTKNEGTIPVVDLDQNEMPEVKEGDNILDGTLVTTDVAFKCAKHGLIQSLTSELVDDAEVEIESLVNKNFAEIVTVAENTKILKIITDNATAIVATSYEDLEKAIDASLPTVKAGLVTITNVSGYVTLKNMKDTQKRPLNLITEVNGVEYFHGKPILYVEDVKLPVDEGKTFVAYISNPKEAIKFCDRKAVTVARSTEAGFTDDTVKVRILERFGVVKGSTRSIKKIEF